MTDRRPSLSRRFSEWAERRVPPAITASATVSSWIGAGVLGTGIVLLGGKAPFVRDFFRLRTEPALIVLAIVCGYHIVGIPLTRDASAKVKAVLAVFGSAFVLWFTASLVALSSERGATVLALLPVFVAAYHGYLYRQAPRYPFIVVSIVAGFGGALALAPARAPLFALIVPLAVGMSLMLGSVAVRSDEMAEERERLRDAVAAQALEEKSREAQHLSTALLDVLGRNHDVGNSLAAARVNADWLFRETEKGAASLDAEDLHTMSGELRDSLERIARIFAESRRIAKEMGPRAEMQEVSLLTSLARSSKGVETKFHKSIRVTPDVSSSAHVLVRGGVINLERILENLLANAFEGDGERRAGEVEVIAKEGPIGFVTIAIVDDGPGFSEESLSRGVSAFDTTKHHGSGLGLYTAERLVVASGGRLVRANRPEGGAVVRVVLAKGGMA